MHFVSAFVVKQLMHRICVGNHKKPNQNPNPQNLDVDGNQKDLSHKNCDLLRLVEKQNPRVTFTY